MAEEIAFENGQISNFEGLVTLTLDWVILHTVVHFSSTSTYMPNLIEIEETFCGWTNVRTHVCTDGYLRPALLGQLCKTKGSSEKGSTILEPVLCQMTIDFQYTSSMKVSNKHVAALAAHIKNNNFSVPNIINL